MKKWRRELKDGIDKLCSENESAANILWPFNKNVTDGFNNSWFGAAINRHGKHNVQTVPVKLLHPENSFTQEECW